MSEVDEKSKICIVIGLENNKLPFWITKNTSLNTMKTVIEKVAPIEIEKFILYDHRTDFTPIVEMKDFEKCLVGDYGVKENQYVKIIGKKTQRKWNFDSLISIYVSYNNDKYLIKIASTTTVGHIITTIENNMNIIPSSIKLSFNGKELNNPSSYLIQDIGLKENSIIQVVGINFPKDLLRKAINFGN